MAGRVGVDVLLEDCGVEHAKTSDEEAESDTLDGSEVNLAPAESRVDEEIENWNTNDEADRVQVLDKIVRCTVERHAGGDGAQVVVDLRVAEVEEGQAE